MAAESKSDDIPQTNKDGVYECDPSKVPQNTEILQSKAVSMLLLSISPTYMQQMP